jgi:hypothetical protein
MPSILARGHAKSRRYDPVGIKIASLTEEVGDGSLYSPWPLQYGLDHLPPGHTLYVRGGTYVGSFTADLDGTQESHRRIVKSFPGEWAIIDSQIYRPTDFAPTEGIRVNGDYWTLRDLEFTNTDTHSRVLDISVPYVSNRRGSGVSIYGTHNEQINCLFHDAGVGVGWWVQSGGGLAYGCNAWNNGWVGGSNYRGHGRGWYTQTLIGDAPKHFEVCMATNNGESSIQAAGGPANLGPFEFVGCQFANASGPSYTTGILGAGVIGHTIEHGSSDGPFGGLLLDRVMTYELPGTKGGGVHINEFHEATSTGQVIRNSRLQQGWVDGALIGDNVADVDIHDNIIVADGNGGGQIGALAFTQGLTPTGTWDYNDYYYKNGSYGFKWTGHPSHGTFAEWKSGTGYDAHSTSTNGNPPDSVHVEPNTYETGRSHVAIYNQVTKASTVMVDLSGTGLVNGDVYYVFNGMNPLAGSVASGTYAGNPVAFPMTDATAGTPADPVGDLPAGPSTFPDFGAFIVRKYNTMQRAV